MFLTSQKISGLYGVGVECSMSEFTTWYIYPKKTFKFSMLGSDLSWLLYILNTDCGEILL